MKIKYKLISLKDHTKKKINYLLKIERKGKIINDLNSLHLFDAECNSEMFMRIYLKPTFLVSLHLKNVSKCCLVINYIPFSKISRLKTKKKSLSVIF